MRTCICSLANQYAQYDLHLFSNHSQGSPVVQCSGSGWNSWIQAHPVSAWPSIVQDVQKEHFWSTCPLVAADDGLT
eukprot:6454733-Amphidinium_carterae.1